MDGTEDLSLRSRRGKERRVWRAGLVVSLLLHVAVAFFWRGALLPEVSSSAAGPERGDPRAAAGAMQALNLREAETTPVVPPPVPVAVEVTVEPIEFDEEPSIDPAELLGNAPGLAEAPGVEAGTGTGNQGDSEEGADLLPPSPRGMIIPPTNRDLRGTEVQVWVFVDAAGRVVADSTRLEPPTGNRDFNRRLVQEAAEWTFRPASRAGTPVAAWFPYRIIM